MAGSRKSDVKQAPIKPYKVACVDLDGTAELNGKFNEALIHRLKDKGYDEVIIFTQRSRHVRLATILLDRSRGNRQEITVEQFVARFQQDFKHVSVSTSLDRYFGAPTDYFENSQVGLKSFDKMLKEAYPATYQDDERQTYIPLPQNIQDAALDEILAVQKKVIPDDHKPKTADELRPDISRTSLAFYPIDKNEQLRHLITDKILADAKTADATSIQIDYYDDSLGNHKDMQKQTFPVKPQGYLVAGEFVVNYDYYNSLPKAEQREISKNKYTPEKQAIHDKAAEIFKVTKSLTNNRDLKQQPLTTDEQSKLNFAEQLLNYRMQRSGELKESKSDYHIRFGGTFFGRTFGSSAKEKLAAVDAMLDYLTTGNFNPDHRTLHALNNGRLKDIVYDAEFSNLLPQELKNPISYNSRM